MKYLRNLDAPVVKWKIHYTNVNPTDIYNALIECLHQKLGSLATRATFMLLRNVVVEQYLING